MRLALPFNWGRFVPRAWHPAPGRYLAVTALGHLAWEGAQVPLYTLWWTGTPGQVAWAVVHCTAGDVLIAAVALAGSLLLFGGAGWPRTGFRQVAAPTVILGLAAAVVIELVATAWGAWSYSGAMPVLPGLGVGLAPVAQWAVIPCLALGSARTIRSRT